MARSTKKGPFVDEHLIKKVEVLNAANDWMKANCEPDISSGGHQYGYKLKS